MVDCHKEASRGKVTRAMDYLKSHEGNSVSRIWPMVRYHHERYDGKGYPDGRGGEDIPDGARVIAIADSCDAMRSCRPYRSAMSFDQCVDEIKENAGTQFDPKWVKVFLELATTGSID
jgi:HD-GYP domain-containing protein (c-di-GMP phosphodiesterase class II)